jgi:putative heme-binding domain-containing protein
MNLIFLNVLVFLLSWSAFAAERVPWTTSHIQGSPEKPPNYRIARVFPRQSFTNSLDIAYNRKLQRWFVAEQGGKLFTLDAAGGNRHLAADFSKLQAMQPKPETFPFDSLYAFAFDPDFAANGFIYVCYVLKTDIPDGSHVSRFKVKTDGEPEVDLASEEVLITWLSGGHNGCCLKFGPDGYLYISTGDGAGPNPPDPLHTGQDVSDLLSSLLRIDVHHASNGMKYSVPTDNPFVGRPNTRPEIWAFGFRNPWRFGIDQTDGQVWVADVGWELWELIYRVERGGNYGWSIVEGRQPVHTTDAVGPTPVRPPIKDHPHSEAASITGGFVYYGNKFPALKGAFLYGDWETGKIWGIRADKDKVTYSEELTDTTIRVVAFAEDSQGEPIVLDYNGGVYSLEANPTASQPQNFPTKLSATGLFTSVPRHEVAPGVVPFQVNAAMWNDYATAERFVALPFLSSITNLERPWRYPSNAVLVRTVSLEMQRGRAESRKRIETQVLHFNGDGWGAYSYRWNDEQTDGTLVPPEGSEAILNVADASEPGGTRVQPYRFHSRAECLRCHNPWCGTALGFQPEQLSAPALKEFASENYFTAGIQVSNTVVSPYDGAQDLAQRARSYLHVNCSHCHRENAGGAVPAIMNIDLAADKMHMLDAVPTRGTLDLAHARVIAPGEPFSSVALFRNSSTGRSRMPYIGSRLVDEDGIALLREWIAQLPTNSSHDSSKEMESLRASLVKRDVDLQELAARESGSTSAALRLAHAASHPSVPLERREKLARAVLKTTNPLVRELFERFVPADERTPVSQAIAPKQEVLSLKGDPQRGAALLADTARLSCLQCHQYQALGRTFGPPFKKAVANKSRGEILDNIIEPSRQIAPEYVLYTADLGDDDPISGMIVTRDDQEIVLKDAALAEHRIPAAKIKSLKAQQLSAMPEGLLAGLSAQQVADLLEALIVEGK